LQQVWRLLRLPIVAATALLLVLIAGYQRLVSPLLGANCRFVPSCSHYAAQSLKKHGLLRRVIKAGWRLLRCHPLCRGGYDPP
jgi:putative membrane protein insertion efficiency factor